ncbi:hypothetical protein [Lactobacillus sp. W8093]|uniref:type IV toxin-antitoxin system AbiEi family antitoxin domain-containing protein n=1 Tax=Lactobacillus sp. W8093 TaxID=2751038 RepID=UPI001E3413A0|nr:hypothetical protein [Lactobacillus sp. W8093]
MTDKSELENLLKQNNYVLSRKQLTKKNYSGQQIKSYIRDNMLILIDKGIYGSPNHLEDAFYTIQLRLKKGIISLNSALYLFGLSDRVPDKIDLTFPRGYKNSKLKEQIVSHQQVPQMYNLGIEIVKTPAGNNVRVYSIDRTMAEILRPQNHIDPEIINKAYKQYLKQPNKNIAKLLYFARKFKIVKKVQEYLEILL